MIQLEYYDKDKAAVAKLPPIDGPDHGEDNVIALPIGRTGS